VKERSPAFRLLALLWAAFSIASPGIAAIADGIAFRSSSTPFAHVEATGTSTCPEVHAVDCAACRYMSQAAATPADTGDLVRHSGTCAPPHEDRRGAFRSRELLPQGRAPPSL
jgi:hypothetical protein